MMRNTPKKITMTKSKLYVSLERASWFNDKGNLHRDDGPALEYSDGSKLWYLNGLSNRDDGPAVVYSGGFKAWYLNGISYAEEDYNAKIKSLR